MCSQITTVSNDWKTLSFEKSHTFDGYVFATATERCWYISLSLRDQPRWLREHPDRWRRIADVQQEAAPPSPPVESEIDLGAEPAGPNGQTSSRGVRDNGGDEDDVALVDTLAGDRSPPHEPTLSTPVTTTVENGGVTAAVSETKEPKKKHTCSDRATNSPCWRCHKHGSGGERLDLHSVAKFSQAFDQALFLLIG